MQNLSFNDLLEKKIITKSYSEITRLVERDVYDVVDSYKIEVAEYDNPQEFSTVTNITYTSSLIEQCLVIEYMFEGWLVINEAKDKDEKLRFNVYKLINV